MCKTSCEDASTGTVHYPSTPAQSTSQCCTKSQRDCLRYTIELVSKPSGAVCEQQLSVVMHGAANRAENNALGKYDSDYYEIDNLSNNFFFFKYIKVRFFCFQVYIGTLKH